MVSVSSAGGTCLSEAGAGTEGRSLPPGPSRVTSETGREATLGSLCVLAPLPRDRQRRGWGASPPELTFSPDPARPPGQTSPQRQHVTRVPTPKSQWDPDCPPEVRPSPRLKGVKAVSGRPSRGFATRPWAGEPGPLREGRGGC